MSKFSSIVQYFRACLQADNRSFSLLNFFGKKVEYQYVLPNTELVQPKMPYVPIDSDWGQTVYKDLEIYAKEKTLYACSFFVLGATKIGGKKQKVFAPLILNPVSLAQKDEFLALEYHLGQSILNPSAIQYLTPKDASINTYEYLLEHIPEGYLGFDEGVKIETLLNKCFANVNTTYLKAYPTVLSAKEVDKLYRSRKPFELGQDFSVIPALGVGLIQKTKTARGILNELREIAERDMPSVPLQHLLLGQVEKNKAIQKVPLYVPATLNLAQQNIFHSIYSFNQTLVIGPPGTGKSFTIAAVSADAIAKGQSVLVASSNFQAVEVVAQKLKKDFGLKNVAIAASNKSWRGKVSKRLRNILDGIGLKRANRKTLLKTEGKVRVILNEINNLESILHKREKQELKWGRQLTRTTNTFLLKIRIWWIHRTLRRIKPYYWLFQSLESALLKKNQLLNKWLIQKFKYQIRQVLNVARPDLQQYLKGIQTRIGVLKENLFNDVDLDKVFHALPLWLVSATEVNQIIPLEKELFDIVIIDEATQCDMASAIPLLYRAKKAVIVGDPKQLRHISFLSYARQTQLQQQYNLKNAEDTVVNYRKYSVLDVFSNQIRNQEQVHFLNEHYRSLPDIIRFSNATFYDNGLELMTATPLTTQQQAVFVHQTEGKRNHKGVNEIEAKAILEWVNQKIESEKTLPKSFCQSIGILSPFRDQVNILQALFKQHVELLYIEKYQILIGTPFHFQGEERDVMLLSFCIDEETHPSTFQYINRPDVFNVSITRARQAQHLFLSIPTAKLSYKLLLAQYLAMINTKLSSKPSFPIPNNDFLEDVVSVLQKKLKLNQIYKHYTLAGIELDLVIILNKKIFVIDLIGYPSRIGVAISTERVNMLARMDIKTFPLTYSLWHLKKRQVIKDLKSFLNL